MTLPPELLDLAAQRRLEQQTVAANTAALVRRLWDRVDRSAVLASWDSAVGPTAGRIVTVGQTSAATGAQEYVTDVLTAQGVAPDQVGTVSRTALAGVASDGRPLKSLLRVPAQDTVALLAAGAAAEVAMSAGWAQLQRIVLTQVADAGRVATGVAMVNDRKVTGYIRHLSPPSCARCVILAGRWYRWSAGFDRHPRCDCSHFPSAEVIEPQSPKAIFDSMSPAQLRKAGWSDADVAAINSGADLAQVTNAKRQLQSVTVAGRQIQTTGVGASRRGPVRLTPDSIAEIAAGDREENLRLLRLHGYLN